MAQRNVLGVVIVLVILAIAGVFIAPKLMKDPHWQPLGSSSSSGGSAQIGFIEVQKVFEGSSRGKVQMAAFQEDLAKRRSELEALAKKTEQLKQDAQRLIAQGKNTPALQQKATEFQASERQLAEAQQQSQLALQKAQADVDKSFMDQLRVVTDQLRREEHLDIIQAYDPTKTLSYDPTMDLTQKALVKYNEMYPQDKASEKKAEKKSL